ISCHGMSDGKILASVNGGKAPFMYSWNTGKTTQNIENIPAGHYELTVSDSNRCTAQASADVNEPPSLKVELSLNQVSCHSYSDGQASAFLSGGVQPYSLLWSTGSNETSIYRLKAGSYTLQTSDYNKCRLDTSFTITQPDTLSVKADVTSPYCPDSYDGAITIQPAGGTWPYRILWGRGDASESINQVGDSLYTVKITDAHNCFFVDSISVNSIKGNCLSIPNTFTPNGDGYNDTWEIDHMDLYPKAIVEIYNRWGILLFRSRPGYPDKWDGTWKGKVLPMDSYFYVIDVHNGSKPSTGSVTIIK
ncbi:MAG: gliding motility-associated C-terminal domain-containing protein, partial [Bacteroidota bacterium]|nr:gliding motility-associated C-terminal domain-containing protein [Bacteroidota bacterium]